MPNTIPGAEAVSTGEALEEIGADIAGRVRKQTEETKSEEGKSSLDTDADKNAKQQREYQLAYESASAAGLPSDETTFKNQYYARLTSFLSPSKITEFFKIIGETASLGFMDGPQTFEIFIKLLASKFGFEDLSHFKNILRLVNEFEKKYPSLRVMDTALALAFGDPFASKQIPMIYTSLGARNKFDDIAPLEQAFKALGNPSTDGFKQVSELQLAREKEKMEKEKLEMTKGKYDTEMIKGRSEYNAGVLKNLRDLYTKHMNGPLGTIMANWSRLLNVMSSAGTLTDVSKGMIPGGNISTPQTARGASNNKFIRVAAPPTSSTPSFSSLMGTGPSGGMPGVGTLPSTAPAANAASMAAADKTKQDQMKINRESAILIEQHGTLSEQIEQIKFRIDKVLSYSYGSSIEDQKFFSSMTLENIDSQAILTEVENYKNTIEYDIKILNQLIDIAEKFQNDTATIDPSQSSPAVVNRASLVKYQQEIAARQQELITSNVYTISLPIEIQIIQVKAQRESAFQEKENAKISGSINLLPVYDALIATYKTEIGLRTQALTLYSSTTTSDPNTNNVFKGMADRTKRIIRAMQLEIKKFRIEMSPGVYKNPFRESEANKFIKIAKYEKVADEVIEDYYNDLYENDPPYGTILEHPSKFRKTPSYNIRRKKKKRTI
jgi:hypothetical protein